MRKKFIAIALTSLLAMSLLVGCGNTASNNNNSNSTEATSSKYEKIDTDLKVGMSTDAGTIDDRSFNQSTWEGISGSVENAKYLQPSGQTDADYLESIGNLYDAGYKFIILPGFKFERAMGTAQYKYPDAKFVILDGAPVNEAGEVDIATNSVGISFAEQESSFIAGVAAAVQIKEGDFGFIGGMASPAVQRFNLGFQQGIKYANENLGTNITLKEENVVYQGAFDDKAGGQQVAAQMYDRGVKVIFTAAGGTGMGAIAEAKSRAANGDTSVYVIGVDVDQYADGVYDQATNASVILTSALKNIDQAAIDMINAEVAGQFPGGQALVLSVVNNGVGIPAENPNLSEDTMNQVNTVIQLIKDGKITILAENDGSFIK
ncbi:MAG: BMP family ABC transporter substrate-binding protein [Cellulosilyticum sp.]|nr:BMP family ABC transporter substrate-binding protein [Cellulosilyticum sp.]